MWATTPVLVGTIWLSLMPSPIKSPSLSSTTSPKWVYGWFTEGFDTADLKEAKALLDELR
jgi:hypothetical protein